MFERTPSSRPAAGQPAVDPAAARLRADQALARALALRRALDELDRKRLMERSGAPAAPSQPARAGLPLQGAVGLGRENRPADLRATRRRLAALGYAPALQTWQELPVFDPLLETGLRAFQAGRGLPADGWMRPGGETERALAAARAAAPADALNSAAPPIAAPQDAGLPWQPPRYAPDDRVDPLLHRPVDPFAIDRDSLGRPFPSRPGAQVGAAPTATRDPMAIRVAQAGPLVRGALKSMGPIFAGPLLYMLQTNKPFRNQLQRGGIDPDDAIAALADLGGGPLTATDQRLQQFLDAQPRFSLDPTDIALQSVLRAYLAGRTLAAEASGSGTAALPTSGATSRFDTPADVGSERRQTSPLGPTPPFEPDRPPEDDGTEGRPAERAEPTILPGGLDGVEFPHTTQIPIPDDDLPRIFAFPGDPSEFPQVDIVERKGNALTKAEIDQIRNGILDSNEGWEHINGGRNRETGAEMREYRVPGWGIHFKDEWGRPGDSRPGSFFTDITFRTPDGRIIHVQHADVDSNGNIREYEWEKANKIRERTGHDVILIGKKWQQKK